MFWLLEFVENYKPIAMYSIIFLLLLHNLLENKTYFLKKRDV